MADQLTEEQIAEFKVSQISIFLLSHSRIFLSLSHSLCFSLTPQPAVLLPSFFLNTQNIFLSFFDALEKKNFKGKKNFPLLLYLRETNWIKILAGCKLNFFLTKFSLFLLILCSSCFLLSTIGQNLLGSFLIVR